MTSGFNAQSNKNAIMTVCNLSEPLKSFVSMKKVDFGYLQGQHTVQFQTSTLEKVTLKNLGDSREETPLKGSSKTQMPWSTLKCKL